MGSPLLKAAVIGVGSMGSNHARIYSEMGEVELIAVADPQWEIARHIAGRYDARAYREYRDLLESERPDLVSIAVPTADHCHVALDCMESGCHMLIEKPIASSIVEGQRMIARAEELGRKLMVGHIVRFNPAIQALKHRLQDAELGKIFQITCRRVGPFPPRIRDVGVVVDLATHDLDLMRFLTGLEPTRVYAEIERRIHTEHEDLLLGLLRFPDGVSGSLEINWLTPIKVREIQVLGERGMFRVDDLTQDLYFFENASASGEFWATLRNLKGVSEGSMTRYPLQRHEPLKTELQAFVGALIRDEPVPISGTEGLQALRLALALVESGRTNRVVEVTDVPA